MPEEKRSKVELTRHERLGDPLTVGGYMAGMVGGLIVALSVQALTGSEHVRWIVIAGVFLGSGVAHLVIRWLNSDARWERMIAAERAAREKKTK